MSDNKVGAGILSIITESLYDNPIVVFREYVQNSIDSIFKNENQIDKCEIRIWQSGSNLFFLDNGLGIERAIFKDEMIKIGASTKKKQKNLGYKGIGRLSGVPYCEELIFVNIYDYSNNKAQLFTIDGNRYEQIKKDDEYSLLSFTELMAKIGKYETAVDFSEYEDICLEIQQYDQMLKRTNTGFLVVLKNISPVLKNTVEDEDFFVNLQWLLPVDFDTDLYKTAQKELFEELTNKDLEDVVPARYCRIYYNDTQIFRPIKNGMLRDYVCKSDFKYAIGFHTFKGDRIAIDKNNSFSGIRIYIDNMLLCDENELLQSLDHYGLLTHTSNGQLQSVRGIGAMIYITDKINISANARRTFIEVTDNASLEFLKMLAEFVNTIYDTRYALSNYMSAKKKQQSNSNKLNELKSVALENLKKLANGSVELTSDSEDIQDSFLNMSITEKKKVIKKKISYQLEQKLREYLKLLDNYNLEKAYDDFCDWLQSQ